MTRMIYDWVMSLEKAPLITALIGVALAAAWMTEIHLTMSHTQAAISEISSENKDARKELWRELNSLRQTNVELLQSIDRRLSRIEGKLDQ